MCSVKICRSFQDLDWISTENQSKFSQTENQPKKFWTAEPQPKHLVRWSSVQTKFSSGAYILLSSIHCISSGKVLLIVWKYSIEISYITAW